MILWYYMNWLTHDFWTRTGGWEIDRSHGAGTSSTSHWQQVEEEASKPDSRQAELFAKNVDDVRLGQSSQNGNTAVRLARYENQRDFYKKYLDLGVVPAYMRYNAVPSGGTILFSKRAGMKPWPACKENF